ncbi:uncharacterized protein LOC142988441, partial [Genypterus blacodes]|uniref:uncharacterized protein LOC142988441 n=1 Tax=Genypterus blacodes TaxID=154954 RepID=UPI003F75A894
ILSQRDSTYCSRARPVCAAPSCPPYSLMFCSPQVSCRSSRRNSTSWAPSLRNRSYSLNSADTCCMRPRTVNFLISDSEDEEGYVEDNESSSTDDTHRRPKSRGWSRSSSPKDPLYRVREQQLGVSAHRRCASAQGLRQHTASPPQHCRQNARDHRSQQGARNSKKQQHSQVPVGRKHMQNTPAGLSAPRLQQQQRPSSAGPVVKDRSQKGLQSSVSHRSVFDSASELLSALSQEERELLEAVTQRGHPLRTAILALHRTGYRSPQKILKYLDSSERLCELGYEKVEVEEAMEMFQNCESKAAEFLHLLAQFNEMGFQQSAIKEVLLLHENHREKALEELMTRMA